MENQAKSSTPQTTNLQVPTVDEIISRRPLIPGAFALVILSFMFVFFDLKCKNESITSVSGYKLLTGMKIDSYNIDPNLWAQIAFVAAIYGLFVFIIKLKNENFQGIIAGGAGFLALVILQISAKSPFNTNEFSGMIVIDFKFGYWLALFAFLYALLVCFMRRKKKYDEISPTAMETIDQQQRSKETLEQ